MTWIGTLEYRDVGTGGWALAADSGETIGLVGEVPRRLNGRRVQVEGEVIDAMGVAMVGTRIVEVHRVRAL